MNTTIPLSDEHNSDDNPDDHKQRQLDDKLKYIENDDDGLLRYVIQGNKGIL